MTICPTLIIIGFHYYESFIFFSAYSDHRDLHSFPTRRSSDLGVGEPLRHDAVAQPPAGHRIRLGEAVHDEGALQGDRKSTRLNSSHGYISYAVFCLKKKKCKQKGRERRGDRQDLDNSLLSHEG